MPKKRRKFPKLCLCCGGCLALPLVLYLGSTSIIAYIYRDNIRGFIAEMKQSQEYLKVSKPHIVSEHKARYISGEIRNTSQSKTYDATSVTFDLFDKENTELDKAQGETDRPLKPGVVWRFKVKLDDARVKSFKLHSAVGLGDLSKDPNIPPFLRSKLNKISSGE